MSQPNALRQRDVESPTPISTAAASQASVTRLLPVKLSFLIVLFDIAAMMLAVVLALTLPHFIPGAEAWTDFRPATLELTQRLYYYGFFCLLLLIGFANKGHYTRRVPWWSQVLTIFKFLTGVVLLDGFTYFSLQEPFSRFLIFGNWLILGVLLLVARRLSFVIMSRSPSWRLPVVLIGDASIVTDSFYAFYADGLTGYEVKKVLLLPDEPLDLSFLPKAHPPVEVIDGSDGVSTFIRNNPGYFYIIALDRFRGSRRDKLMRTLETTNRDYAIIPPMKRLHLHGMEPHYFFGNDIMLLHKRYSITAPLGRAAKRGLDIFVSGMSLPFLGIATAIIFTLKRVEGSESPVFYGGMRVGLDGKLFPCWKFCTMKRNADAILGDVLAADPEARKEWDKFQKLKNDPRVDSSISKILRKTSLDELPQLWNVFTGDMSLVGPRPILPDQKVEYGEMLPQYQSVRPGLTGLWQVSGRNETSFQQRIAWDSWYIRNWSLWHDIVILIKTVKVFTSSSGAY